MTDNLFNATPTTEAPVTAPAVDPLLASITDETGKQKYASVEAALKALQNAQAHIKTIETENSQLREATTKAKTMEEILQAIKPSEAAPAPAPAAAPAPVKTDAVDIATVVAQTVLGLEAKKAEAANIQSVVDKMKKVYGEAAGDTFYTKAAELGFSQEDINGLSRKNPTAVFKLFGLEDKTPTKVPTGSIRTDAFNANQEPPKRSGMAHGDTKQLVDSWRASIERTNAKLGITK